MKFDLLVQSIADVHRQMQARALKAVNVGLTLRNWLIGCLISHYNLRGEDRALYGDKVVERLSQKLRDAGIGHAHRRDLYRYCDFFQTYPQIVETVSPQLPELLHFLPVATRQLIVATASPQSPDDPFYRLPTGESTAAPSDPIVRTASGQLQTPSKILVERLSYSHLELLTSVEHPLKRTFYEIEAIKGCWSVRELKRQIGSLYFERSGLSKDKEALARLAHDAAEPQTPAHLIRDPFLFDFLGIPTDEALSESALEDALMRHLQSFLLELGRGFCFEARQKRLLIGGEHFFCDLVFYHRILKCHVLVELKVDHFRHEHLGQLNAYLGWFREHEMQPGDQPPVGILLCTDQNDELVRYALAGLDQQVFVSRYQLQLPATEELAAFLKRELEQWKEGRE